MKIPWKPTMSFCIGVVVAGGLCLAQGLGGAEGQAQTWKKLRAADFPARVQTVVFDDGVWNARTSWAWGRWTAQFGSATVAEFVKCDNAICPSFRIEHLVCTNPVVGESSCTLSMTWRIAFADPICTLTVEKQRRDVTVRCPLEVRLQ